MGCAKQIGTSDRKLLGGQPILADHPLLAHTCSYQHPAASGGTGWKPALSTWTAPSTLAAGVWEQAVGLTGDVGCVLLSRSCQPRDICSETVHRPLGFVSLYLR